METEDQKSYYQLQFKLHSSKGGCGQGLQEFWDLNIKYW